METPNNNDFKKDLKIYFFVLITTAMIIGISLLKLKTVGIALIVLLAAVEAVVVAYYFMHLMTKKKTIQLILFLTVIVFITLLFWPAWDMVFSPRTPSDYVTQ